MLYLLRIAFLSSQKRDSLWNAPSLAPTGTFAGPDKGRLPLSRVSVIPRRLSFTGDGATDSADYAFFLFDAAQQQDLAARAVVLDWQEF